MSQLYEDPQQIATAEAALQERPRTILLNLDTGVLIRTGTMLPFRYQFRMELSDPLKDELARVGVPQSLDALINLFLQINRHLREQRSERATGQSRPIWMLPRVPSFFSLAPPGLAASITDTSKLVQLGLLRPSRLKSINVVARTICACILESQNITRDPIQQSSVSAYQFLLPFPQLCQTALLTSLFLFCYSFQAGISRSPP